MKTLDLSMKQNHEQNLKELENQLNNNFNSNYSKLRKTYQDNKGSEEFFKFFIQSSILETHFKDLLLDYKNIKKDSQSKSFFSIFLYDYFSQDKYINIEFLKEFKKVDLSLFEYFFYKNKVYQSPKHIKSLKKIFSEHDKFMELTLFLNKICVDLSYKEKEIKKLLNTINFLDLLCLTQYHLNTHSIMALKKDNLVGPKILDDIASKILNYKIELDNKEYKITQDNFIIKVGKTVEVSEGKRKKNNKITKILFDFFKKVTDFENLIDSLRFEQYDYNFLNFKTCVLQP